MDDAQIGSETPGEVPNYQTSVEIIQPATETQPSWKRGNDWNDVSRQSWQETKRARANYDSQEETGPRQPKRKVACIIGYCGTGYHGMQINPPSRTIEGALFEAFVKVGAVSSDNADDPKKVSFLRAARTDKGVHAAINVISLKMIIEDPEILTKINANLPEQIRVWRIVRAMKSFNPRTSCDSRIYEYLIPSSSFIPPQDATGVSMKIQDKNASHILHDNAATFWQETEDSIEVLKRSTAYSDIKDTDQDVGVLALDHTIPEADKPAAFAQIRRSKLIKLHILDRKHQFRISAERLNNVRRALASFQGTKNFHNYTLGQSFKQASSKRFIKSFEASEPFTINGTEWLSLKVHGQSFMLHQIRKMVSMVLLLVRYSCPLSVMETTFEEREVHIPKAPSLGLLLERPIFDAYNTKSEGTSGKAGIVLDDDLNETINVFKMNHLYDKIYAEEERDSIFYTFLTSLDAYASIGQFSYLFGDQDSNPPDPAIVRALP